MVSRALHFALCLFFEVFHVTPFRVLKEEEDARVDIPSAEEVSEYQDVVQTNYPALTGTWCIMDGLKIHIEKSSDESTQLASYNG
jgi:hypothetical protein